jgi:hypothetical protein
LRLEASCGTASAVAVRFNWSFPAAIQWPKAVPTINADMTITICVMTARFLNMFSFKRKHAFL